MITTSLKIKIWFQRNKWCSIGMNQIMTIVTNLSGIGQKQTMQVRNGQLMWYVYEVCLLQLVIKLICIGYS